MSPGEIPRVGYYMYVILGVNRGTCRQHLGGALAAPVRAPKQRGEGRRQRVIRAARLVEGGAVVVVRVWVSRLHRDGLLKP